MALSEAEELELLELENENALAAQNQPEQSKWGMAGQAIGETLSEDIPGLGKVASSMRDDIPNWMAEKGGMPGAAAGALVGTAGEFIPKTGTDLALNLAGPAIKGGAAAVRGGSKLVSPAVKWALPKMSSVLTGLEEPIVRRWLDKTENVSGKLKDVLNSDVGEMVVLKMKNAAKEGRRFFGQVLGQVEDAVAARNKTLIPTADIGDQLATALANKGYGVKGYMGSEVSSKLSPSTVEILDDFKNLQGGKAARATGIIDASGKPVVSMGAAPESKPMSWKGVLNLRRKIDRAVDFAEEGSMKVGVDEEAILKEARKALNERLLASDDTFREANDKFAEVAENYRALAKDMFSGKEETVRNRIAKVFKKDSMERRLIERLDAVSESGMKHLDDLLNTISAEAADPRINPAMGQAFRRTGGGMMKAALQLGGLATAGATASGAISGPAAVGTLGAVAAATSPRLNFRVIQASKMIGGVLKKLGISDKSALAASLSAPAIHNAILEQAMDEYK